MENYVVSARKYRPDTFDTVVGQGHVTQTLLNEIKNNHLAQAFLFNGPRGVGKTTCARILAKEINKDTIKDESHDFSYNIFELDAASNNSVDDVRLLNEQVRIPPQVGKYKVYIIDEVHMLSASAFNAFLKTLEEPPPYAIFILATTERHKILPTILSRCQIFNFKRITVPDMVTHLAEIASKEGISTEEEALHIIAQKADGALRDALSIFDQMASIGDGKISYANVIENLNVLDYDVYFSFTDAFLSEDVAASLVLFDDILQKGFDPQVFLNGLANHFRDLMVVSDERTLMLLDVPPHIRPKYLEVAKKVSKGFLVNAINIANSFDQSYKASRNQRLHVELAIIKICYLLTLINPAEKKNDSRLSTTINSEDKTEKPPVLSASGKEIKQETTTTEIQTEVPQETTKPKSNATNIPKSDSADLKVAKIGNLDALLSGKPKVTTKAPETKIEKEEIATEGNESFDLDKVNEAFNLYSDNLASNDQSRLQSIFKFMDVSVENETIRVHLNKQHRIQMEDIKIEFLAFLRKQLLNSALVLELEDVQQTTKEKKPYTSVEKFEVMAKANPDLQALKDALGLKVE